MDDDNAKSILHEYKISENKVKYCPPAVNEPQLTISDQMQELIGQNQAQTP